MREQLGRAAARFWAWTLAHHPPFKWRAMSNLPDKALVFTVFGLTGSASVMCVRPCLGKVGIEGSLRDGPWSYRIASVALVSPAYAVLLVALGTLSGRHRFFGKMSARILSRFGPLGRGLDRALCRRPPGA
jgi:hypothetical protein